MTVYPCLSSVSGFDQSVTSESGPTGTPARPPHRPVPSAGLAHRGRWGRRPVHAGGRRCARRRRPPGTFTIDLCPRWRQCRAYPAGVYPVRVQLVDTAPARCSAVHHPPRVHRCPGRHPAAAGGCGAPRPDHRSAPPAHRPRPHSWRRPVCRPGHRRRRHRSAVAPRGRHRGAVTAVPVTLDGPARSRPWTTVGAAGTTTRHRGPAGQPGGHTRRSTSSLDPVHPGRCLRPGRRRAGHRARPPGGPGGATVRRPPTGPPRLAPAGLGAWITDDPLDATATSQLGRAGTASWSSRGSVTSAADQRLDGRAVRRRDRPRSPFTAVAVQRRSVVPVHRLPGNPVLAAHQLVAELAQIYFEKPNDTTPRAVVAVAPTGWADQPRLRRRTAGRPRRQPDHPGGDHRRSCSPLDPAGAPAARAAGCAGATGGRRSSGGRHPRPAPAGRRLLVGRPGSAPTPSTTQLGDLVLAGESEVLRPAQQSAVLANTGAAVDAQLGQLGWAATGPSPSPPSRGTVPVTIVSNASYPVIGHADPDQRQAALPQRHHPVDPDRSLPSRSPTPVDVPVAGPRPRACSGWTSSSARPRRPRASTGEVDVRSTATSVVGVVLSVGRRGVLAVWWFRTHLAGGRRRRADGAEDRSHDRPTPGAPDDRPPRSTGCRRRPAAVGAGLAGATVGHGRRHHAVAADRCGSG